MAETSSKFPHPLYEKYVLQPFFRDAETYYYEPMLAANRAHVVMLTQCGIMSEENAKALLLALDDVEEKGLKNLGYQSGVEDLFFTIEQRLIEHAGVAYGGNIQLARSRNDLGYALTRLALRPLLLKTIKDLIALRRSLHALASEHTQTVMPGYTHTQPAQPSTMAHYLAGMLSVLERDTKRLQFAYNTNNESPLGAAALTGTGFPVDRELVASLLGFGGVIQSTYDSIASSDNLTDTASACTSIGINLSRFVHDMLFWAMQESSAIRIDDSFIQISSIMPQKRNPVVLEHIRARISRMIGFANAVVLQCHSIPFGDTQDIEDEIFPQLFGSLETAQEILQLYAAVIDTLHINVDHLLQRAIAGFTTVTELADTLVREAHLPFRQAHSIVSKTVNYALANHLAPADITAEVLATVSTEVLDSPLELDETIVQAALDPVAFVNKRTGIGGTSPEATQAVLDQQAKDIDADEDWLSMTNQRLTDADAQLKAAVDRLLV